MTTLTSWQARDPATDDEHQGDEANRPVTGEKPKEVARR
jgi:hypothetical protein